jgi:hypothetical protein
MASLFEKTRLTILIGIALATVVGTAWADTFTGPVSKYYLVNPINNTIYVIQGTAVVATFPMAYGQGNQEGALAVSETIRTRASDLRFAGGLSGEYTLAGAPTGYDYLTPPSGNLRYYDGTSDGLRTYFVDHGQDNPETGGVYVADYYWQQPQWLFYPQAICNSEPQPGCHGLSGIAYDKANNSLWISGKGNTMIGNYSLNGVLLAAFDAANSFGYNAALGVDPMDHTLWVTSGGSNVLRQYSLNGSAFGHLLQSGTPNGLPPEGVYESGEFQIVQCSAPTITALSATPVILWPPNHKMVPVTVTGATIGGCGAVACSIATVSSNEPVGPDGDWQITSNLTLSLRAERLGTGTGRVYTINVQCKDSSGNVVSRTTNVNVPKDIPER